MTQTPPPRFGQQFLDSFDDLLHWRRDVRHFDPRPIDQDLLNSLLDRACLAPSVGNSQPWRFVRVVSPHIRQAVTAHVESENARAREEYDGRRRTAYAALKVHGLDEAPEHIAVFSDSATAEGHGLGRRTMPETLHYSTVTAVYTFWLAARARGIGLGWVSILDPQEIVRLLKVPSSWKFIGYMCVGYPSSEEGEPELERLGWQARINPQNTRFTR